MYGDVLTDWTTVRNTAISHQSRLDQIFTILDGMQNHPMEYDDQIVRQILEGVVVESKETIKVVFIGGLEVREQLIALYYKGSKLSAKNANVSFL